MITMMTSMIICTSMRTIKRESFILNASKLQSLKDLAKAYTAEKQYWLRELQSFKMQASLGYYRLLRNELILKK